MDNETLQVMQPTVMTRIEPKSLWYEITPKLINYMLTDQGRIESSQNSFFLFLGNYYKHKIQLPPADFHRGLIETLQDVNDFIAILGFRGSAKSTILEAYALWCMITGRSKYTIYIGSTDTKSKQSVANIKAEIESNELLRKDFNIVLDNAIKTDMSSKWGEGQITVHGNTIVAKSRGAKGIRGSLFDGSRLTLIICDDIEDTDNTKSQEQRAKTREWFFTEVVPATAQGVLASDVKIVMIGNLVHRDCLLAHLDDKKLENQNIINVMRFPLLDENGEITWKGLYPDMEAVNKQKQKVMLAGQGMGAVIWAREYLLKMIDDEAQIIKDTDIQYYPDEWLQREFISGAVGVDLAISLKQTADYTSMVKAVFVKNDFGEKRLLVLRNPIKQRLQFEETISTAKVIKSEMPPNSVFYVEDVAYQKASIEIMQKNGINAVGVKPLGDKRSRLISISPYIKSGMVLFPKQGAEAILEEVIGFGIEPHDDVLDAFVHVVGNMLNRPEVICV
jgi:predicted phage terminase large subunit-like protein